jgi:hypothetical protein
MDEQLQSKLIEIITSIQTAIKTASDFAIEQLPDIAIQYVLYGRVKTAFITAFMLFVSAALFSGFLWAYKNPWNISSYAYEKNLKRSDSNILVMIFTVLLASTVLACAIFSFDWLVWFAPKVWLLKELAGLIR